MKGRIGNKVTITETGLKMMRNEGMDKTYGLPTGPGEIINERSIFARIKFPGVTSDLLYSDSEYMVVRAEGAPSELDEKLLGVYRDLGQILKEKGLL